MSRLDLSLLPTVFSVLSFFSFSSASVKTPSLQEILPERRGLFNVTEPLGDQCGYTKVTVMWSFPTGHITFGPDSCASCGVSEAAVCVPISNDIPSAIWSHEREISNRERACPPFHRSSCLR